MHPKLTFNPVLAWSMSAVLLLAVLLFSRPSAAQSPAERLLRAYPEQLRAIDGNDLIWADNTRMPIDDGRGAKSFEQWLAAPDLKDMFAIPYPKGVGGVPPAENSDPGRARPAAFFVKMYGDCTKDGVVPKLVDVVWLPKKVGQKLKVTSVNGVAEKLAAVSRALDDLPASFDLYLVPSAGTYVCRPIAGTIQLSAHAYGIAVDISTKAAHYWRWSRGGVRSYQNKIPIEIVQAFEAYGFIWGGKWWHYDTMHFEYRPELLPRDEAKSSE